MIYEWKCKNCELHKEVTRAVSDYSKPPTCKCNCDKTEWVKVYKSSTPFQLLRESGELPDEHGNIAPRKL